MSYGEGLRADLPDTSAVVQGTMDNVSQSLAKGQYVGGVAKGVAGSLALIPAALNDTVGAAVRSLRDPAEDAGRALLGMPDRVPAPAAAPVARAQPVISPDDQSAAESNRLLRNNTALKAGVAPLGNGQNGVPNVNVDTPEAQAMRKAQRDMQTQKDIALGNAMEANRLRAEQQGFNAQAANAAQNQAIGDAYQRRMDKANLQTSASSIVNDGAKREASARLAAMDTQDNNLISQAGENTRAGMKSRSDQQIASLRDATERRGQDMTYDANMANYRTQSESNRARLSYEMGKDKRDFELRSDEHMMKKRENADKNFTSELQSMFTTKNDKGESVVDNDAVASHKAAITAHLNTLISAAEKRGDMTTAEKLRIEGPAALGKDHFQKIVSQHEVKRRAQGAHSTWNTFGGNYVDSNEPSAFDIVGVKKGLLQDQYQLRGGSTVPTRVLDYMQGGNPILPNAIGDVPTQRFDTIKQLRN